MISRLQIRNASVSIVYKCSAENKVGKDERQINFYVTSKFVEVHLTQIQNTKFIPINLLSTVEHEVINARLSVAPHQGPSGPNSAVVFE